MPSAGKVMLVGGSVMAVLSVRYVLASVLGRRSRRTTSRPSHQHSYSGMITACPENRDQAQKVDAVVASGLGHTIRQIDASANAVAAPVVSRSASH